VIEEKFSKVGGLVAYLIGNDVAILNGEGICVASSDSRKIGRIIKINQENKLAKTSLKLEGYNSSFSLIYKKDRYSPNELGFIKNLAKMTLGQFLSTISQPTGTIDQFITELIDQPLNSVNVAALESEAQSLGLNIEAERVAIVVEINNFTQDMLSTSTDQSHEDIIREWKNKITAAISGFFTIKTDIITSHIGNGRFVLFKEIIGDKEKFIKYMKTSYSSIFSPLIESTQDNLTVGFSDPHSGVLGLHESYHEAVQALSLLGKFAKKKNQSYYYGDLGTLRILTETNVEKKKSFAHDVLEPLDKETSRLTLETFFNEDMDIKKTAAKLKVHPNTVNYRIGKIAEDLGLDPRIFRQAFELRIAILTDKLFE
jgi:sugar diacid utilization regulator